MYRVLALLSLVLLLAACGGAQAEVTPEATAAAPTEAPATAEPPTAVPATATSEPQETPMPVDQTPLDGQWQGMIDAGGQQLDIVVTFDSSIGALQGTIDIPQQGASGLPLEDIRLEGDVVHFAIAGAGAEFDGAVSGDAMSGDFTQNGVTGAFELARGDAAEPTAEAGTPMPIDGSPVDGQWEGAIDIGGQKLDIIVKMSAMTGGLLGTIDIPAQGAADLPLDNLSVDGDAVHFEIAPVGAVFDGTLDGETISGDFTQGAATGTFSITRTGDIAMAEPTAVPPYTVEEVTLDLDGTKMGATVTLPEGEGPFPAVVFVAGSGPTDRDWNSPLLPGRNGSAALLADALTRAGYATVRYDKRVTGPYAQDNLAALQGKISFQSHLDELTAAVGEIVSRPEVDPARVYVLGNSEGTLHALNYQASDPATPFAGMVLTGAPGRPLSEVLRQQIAENVLAGEADADAMLAKWDEAIAAFLAGEPDAQLDPSLPAGAQQTFAGLVAPINQPFTAELLAFNPAEYLARMTAPALVVIGRKDIQVDAEADGQALEAVAGDNVTFSYPATANHILKLEEKPVDELTGADAASYNMAGRVLDPEALQTILDWLAAQNQ